MLQGVECVAPTGPDDFDVLSHARPHSAQARGRGLAEEQIFAKVVTLAHRGLQGLQEKVRAQSTWSVGEAQFCSGGSCRETRVQTQVRKIPTKGDQSPFLI